MKFFSTVQICSQICASGTKPNGVFEQLLQKRVETRGKALFCAESVKAQMWRKLPKQGMNSGEGCGG